MTSLPLHVIVGARPNYMKVKVLLELLPDCQLIHSGQHFSPEMAGGFLDRLGIRQPDVILQPCRDSQVKLLASLLTLFETHWQTNRPECVVVVGDVNSTAAAALTASRMGIPVAHIEAGLRSRDLSMPEEVNRILTDSCSRYGFCSEVSGVENLAAEGRSEGIHLVGNTMIDCLASLMPEIESGGLLETLQLTAGEYAVCTFHRPANVDDVSKLDRILARLNRTGYRFVFPVHPRVKPSRGYDNIRMIDPLFYTDFMQLVKNAKFVVTDSGGLQEETSWLGIPCVTFRPNTERPSTIQWGTNELLLDLVDFDVTLDKVLNKQPQKIEYWDGRASHRIVNRLAEDFGFLPSVTADPEY